MTIITTQTPKIFIRQTPMHTPRPKYIIIHNSVCLFDTPINKIEIDTKKYQYDYVKYLHVKELKLSDINYHYILDKINGDYEIILGKPIHSPCIFEDIDDLYYYSIHVSIMGDYNIDMADNRLYEVLAYRVISPLLYWFHLDKNCIKLHSEIAQNKNDNAVKECPGSYFFKEILINHVSKYSSNK